MKTPQSLSQIMQKSEKYLPPEPVNFQIRENARKIFSNLFKELIPDFKYLPEYEQVTNWLENNKGKGLALIGANGRGKTIIGRLIIPVLFVINHQKHFTRVNAQEMNENLDDILRRRLITIDDIGVEDQRVVYGERRWAFPEVMDNAEKNRNIIVFTSNLDAPAIEKKYGLRTRERVRAVCKVVVFKGESLRV